MFLASGFAFSAHTDTCAHARMHTYAHMDVEPLLHGRLPAGLWAGAYPLYADPASQGLSGLSPSCCRTIGCEQQEVGARGSPRVCLPHASDSESLSEDGGVGRERLDVANI